MIKYSNFLMIKGSRLTGDDSTVDVTRLQDGKQSVMI
jgi:hypothetical protein